MVGLGAYWGWPYRGWPYPYWDYPHYYPYGPYWAYRAPVLEVPQVYIEQPQPGYWYYCPSARAYYPQVPTCPEPWVAVAPRPGGG